MRQLARRGHLLEENVDKSERKNRGGHGRRCGNEKVAAVADAHLRVLREVGAEQRRVAFEIEESVTHLSRRGW